MQGRDGETLGVFSINSAYPFTFFRKLKDAICEHNYDKIDMAQSLKLHIFSHVLP